jgi:hypothetical protein
MRWWSENHPQTFIMCQKTPGLELEVLLNTFL